MESLVERSRTRLADWSLEVDFNVTDARHIERIENVARRYDGLLFVIR